MPAPIAGTAGTVKTGVTPGVSVLYLTSVEYEIEQEVEESGPYISDPNTTRTRTGLKVSGSGEGVLVTPLDPGVKSIRTAIMTGADIRIEIKSTGGETLTIPTAIITNYASGLDAEGGSVPVSFDFEGSGAFTLADSTV